MDFQAKLKQALLVACCLLLSLNTANAQSARGLIVGLVQDGTGALIPGARVTATNVNTGIALSAETDAEGSFRIPEVQPGDYKLAAEADGFKRAEVSGLRVNIGSSINQTFTLEIGAVTETIEVSGSALMVETASSTVGSTVQVEQILELPMPNRNVFTLVNLVPGSYYNGGDIGLGGGRTQAAGYYIDGVNNTRGGLGGQDIEMTPPIDSMQEFKVETNNLSAATGRTADGAVSAVTKSGTNDFAGSFYEFLRNDKLDAAGWNNDEKPTLRRNNFGATVGGPIKKNKTFFFFNSDFQRERTQSVRTRSVGLPEFQKGDFSNATALLGGTVKVVPIHDPLSGTGTFTAPKSTTQFANNIIPVSRFDPVAAKVLAGNYIPGANRTANNVANNAGNWQENVGNQLNRDYYTGKVDHVWNSSTRSYARYIRTQPDEDLTGYSQGFGVADQNGLSILNRRTNLAVNTTHIFSPTFLVDFTVGFNKVTVDRKSGDCCDTNYSEKFGLPVLSDVGGEVFPRFNFQGGLVPVDQIGAAGNGHRDAVFDNWDYSVNFSKTAGGHTIKFGGQFTRFHGQELSRPQPSGQWGFDGRWTQAWNANGGRNNQTGIRFADFILGRINSVNAEVGEPVSRSILYYSGYFQDDWKVSQNLTLNLGVRYEVESPVHEKTGRMNGFCLYCPSPLAGQNGIPEGAIGTFTFPNRNGYGKYLWQWDKNNIAPRFGFAWRATGKDNFVIRGGVGLYYGNQSTRNTIQIAAAGFNNLYQARNPIPYTLGEGIPQGALDAIPESELTPNFGARGTRFELSSVQFLDEDRVFPYSENFNLTVQYEVKKWLFEIGAMANLGRHVSFGNINLNHIRPEDLPKLGQGVPELLLRPWQTLTSDQPQIQIITPNWGLSNAWLGTFKAERRLENGFGVTVAYTHTQWIDNIVSQGASFGDNDQVQNIYNLRAERSGSTNRVPHRIVIAPIFLLPFGKGQMFGSNWHPVLSSILGGWEVSTIGTLQSGAPFGVEVLNGARDILGDSADGKTLRPDLVSSQLYASDKGQALSNGNKGLSWLNPDAFAVPAQYTHGNASRTLPGVYGPGIVSFDAMLSKNFTWGEGWRAQFRWEMFNFTNTPQFDLPGQSLGSSGLGQITGAGGRRIMQFGLKIYWKRNSS
ncbi:MAG: TonB-dependent receptor [Bryobacterales bacterium]